VVEDHDMKLGIGGIREIEFFTQTRQLIAGGRDPELRDRTTVGGLAALAAKGWVPPGVAAELTELYRAPREVEHRLQMVQDAQTHRMPASRDGIDRIARFCGEGDTDRFRRDLLDRLARVADLTESFFAPGKAEDGPDLTPRMAETVGVRIIDPPRHRPSRIGKRDDDAERFLALGKIGGAIERVDDPALA